MSSATPNPDSELRQKLIAIEFKTMKEFNRPDYKNIVWRLGEDGIDQILEVLQPYLAASDRRLELAAEEKLLSRIYSLANDYANQDKTMVGSESIRGYHYFNALETIKLELTVQPDKPHGASDVPQ